MRKHFALSISPQAEHTLRQHLTECRDCCAWYERQLVRASLDPRAPSAERRLATGLGFELQDRPQGFSFRVGLAAAVVALCALLVYTKRPAELTARGGAEASGLAQVFVYRVLPGQPARAVDGRMGKADELAFAYVNSAGFKKLMIFGVDEHRHVYWYHPGWSRPSENPRAIGILTGPELRELPEAIAHDLDGKTLTIHALFSNSDLSVQELERLLTEGRALSALQSGSGGSAATPRDSLETEISIAVE
jgi:hypothetical protein